MHPRRRSEHRNDLPDLSPLHQHGAEVEVPVPRAGAER